MRIAFDLDNTLIRNLHLFETELPSKNFWARIYSHELLRKGTSELFHFLQVNHWDVGVYTTSYRKISYIKRMFWLYDIKLDFAINQAIHLKKINLPSSKYPPAFDIDVLVDDALGVKEEGEKYGFEVIHILPDDENWVEKIVSRAKQKEIKS